MSHSSRVSTTPQLIPDLLLQNVWKPIPGYEQYLVSDIGQIYSLVTRKLLSPRLSRFGYLRITIRHERRPVDLLVHRVVWMAHRGNVPPNYDVHHLNQDKRDPKLSNLALIHHVEHAELHSRGSSNGSARTDEITVREIRRLVNGEGVSYSDAARRFGLSYERIKGIAVGRLWKHAGGFVRDTSHEKWGNRGRRRLTDDDARFVRSSWADKTHGIRELARMFGVRHETIRQIIDGRTYKDVV